eukprot:CAMPEP_0173178528 /NCGR_PEP_ID=MMETSP1141-20130122/5591_1 /TAXON_ID=483371 /ORGANISM="non described non described, Strain CCMP2298" /LENGTH=190 /DNA_ID=CAMNT_0014101039 /DNA_START=111 /DNA_END=680 /DNA_ORIENTATION=-
MSKIADADKAQPTQSWQSYTGKTDKYLSGADNQTSENKDDQDANHKAKLALLNDFTNIATIAALVSGFALGTTDRDAFATNDTLEIVAALLFYSSAHASAYAALASAWLYRLVNAKDDIEALQWASARPFTIQSPAMSFTFGACCYIMGYSLSSGAAAVGDSTGSILTFKLTVIIVVGATCALSVISLVW